MNWNALLKQYLHNNIYKLKIIKVNRSNVV